MNNLTYMTRNIQKIVHLMKINFDVSQATEIVFYEVLAVQCPNINKITKIEW